ncbi:nucleotidyl transferase AbiEii/AbiGii toxin family protein [Streptomyces millisiae]|uniref:Nucleotidyl transferase AbiEii/AbiGii toxin family protein n=1 Tax=Streptomyces millisiae TaxID=3075542 RepID=A0ABU2LQ46_9ACTN|nr:nucleotidyl transferase AbiEii/AbiGii toxin family protein [Streptomyces sp. DSM 44918]MDT0319717.1 nucleotidyl transferase AbiEii/AbiGii toxin family protein [Streptomyces sp. DSM 44918]
MSSNDRPWDTLWIGSDSIPTKPLDDETRNRLGYPGTLRAMPEGLRQPLVFDPALKQFPNAYRAGEPRFDDEASAGVWRRARRTALDTVLAAVGNSHWADHLVLRGGVLMSQWFGAAAREPGDLDFVVVPREWQLDGPETTRLFRELANAAAAAAHGPVAIDAPGMAVEDIWTYERAPGRRMLLPWSAPGTPGGTVQVDVVFKEPLPEPPAWTELRPLGEGGPGCRLLTVSPALSLAWKLMWLLGDWYPQGKDLYDAVLLAEREPPSYRMVRDTFLTGADDQDPLRPFCRARLRELSGNPMADGWAEFVREYPSVTGTAHDWIGRLTQALEPLFAEAEPPGEGDHARWARWLAPLVAEARAAAEPAAPLARLAAHGRDGLVAAVVILRELAGPEALPPEEALRAVLDGDDAWAYWRERPTTWPDVLAVVP